MKQNHIIHKVIIEVTVENKEKASMIKDDINSFLTVDVFPKLEKYITTLQDTLPGHTLQISRLVVDIDESEASLNTNLKNNIAKLFKKELTETIQPILEASATGIKNDSHVSLLSEEDKLLQTFIHFLEKGHMPWWNSNKNAINILESGVFKKIILSKAFENRIASSIQKPKVRERIINQFSDSQIKQICLSIIKGKSLKINMESSVIKQLSKLTLTDRNAIWSVVLNVLSEYVNNRNNNLEEYSLQQILKTIPFLKIAEANNNEESIEKGMIEIFPFIKQNQGSVDVKGLSKSKNIASVKNSVNVDNSLSAENISTIENIPVVTNRSHKKNQEELLQPVQTDSFSPSDKNLYNDNSIDENNGYYVQNAGLALIHPFIKNLFKYCDLINPETQKLTDPELCIHLLHYIATGKTNQPESDMLFEKFLCNVSLQQSISRHVKLSRKHKAQAKKVIEAVQQNWSSMKTSSVELLQNEFFQRPGKLVLNNNDYTLTVEHKTQDILLNKLTWGISFIKLPWQDQFTYVNW